jgi:hypothetical protein
VAETVVTTEEGDPVVEEGLMGVVTISAREATEIIAGVMTIIAEVMEGIQGMVVVATEAAIVAVTVVMMEVMVVVVVMEVMMGVMVVDMEADMEVEVEADTGTLTPIREDTVAAVVMEERTIIGVMPTLEVSSRCSVFHSMPMNMTLPNFFKRHTSLLCVFIESVMAVMLLLSLHPLPRPRQLFLYISNTSGKDILN